MAPDLHISKSQYTGTAFGGFIHSFLWHVQNVTIPCLSQELLPFLSVMYIFPATLLHQLLFHPLSPHLAIYFLVYLSILSFPNSYIILFGEFYFLPFSVRVQTNVLHLTSVSLLYDRLCGLVVRVSGYRYRGLGFDSRRYQIF